VEPVWQRGLSYKRKEPPWHQVCLNHFIVESRSIGYYEGNKKVWYTVDEWTGRMEMKVEG